MVNMMTVKRGGLFRRKGGGGGGRGGSGGGSGGSSGGSGGRPSGGSGGGTSSGSGGGGGGSSAGSPAPVPIRGGSGTPSTATAYGSGGGKSTPIPSGQIFAGRPEGGGTRNQVYGSSAYGSGYPGLPGQRGVSGLGFPFYFWPVVWGTAASSGAYAAARSEYGSSSNSSRPGGPMSETMFSSNSTNTTLFVISDNSTVTSLIDSITTNCSSFLSPSTNSATARLIPFNDTSSTPGPEEVVQYYRASSAVLTLEGYNNSAAYSSDPNATMSPLPNGTDLQLLSCVNDTIGASIPLIGDASLGLPNTLFTLVMVFVASTSALL